MVKTIITESYKYLYFESQEEFFNVLEDMLNDGYVITDTVFLAIELEKDNIKYLLSYLYIEEINSNIKDSIRALNKEYKLVKPNMHKCMLNIISSIRKKVGLLPLYQTDKIIDEYLEEDYNNIIVMLLDGMGENILQNNAPAEGFLNRHHIYTNTAVYPSTTAASTTATVSGLSPIRTAWLGWENYFREYNRNLILFTGNNYVNDEPTGLNINKILPYNNFVSDLEIIQPDFSIINYPFKTILKRSLELLKAPKKRHIQYVYYHEPDGLMHEFGAYSDSASKILTKMDEELEFYASSLPEKTLLLISADHGHTDVLPIDFYACKTINKMLTHRPSNDSRCITFSVKEEYKTCFMDIFNKLFGSVYQIYKTEYLIENEFFGLKDEPIPARSRDFLGDFVAVGISNYYFNYKKKGNQIFKSHHAGITADEMLVPVIIYRK